MSINVGSKVPELKATTLSGKPFDIHSINRPTMLQFHRYVGCPVCHMHVHDYIKAANEWKRYGVDVVVIYYSTAEEIEKIGKFKPGDELPIEFISDPEMKFYKRFNVEFSLLGTISLSAWKDGALALMKGHSFRRAFQSKGLGGLPSDFIVMPDGTIRNMHRGKKINDSLPVKEFLKLVRDIA